MNRLQTFAAICFMTLCASIPSTNADEATNATPKRNLYSDTEAQQFLRNLPIIVYPTSISSACERLGIDLSRLGIDAIRPPQTQMMELGTGSTQYHVTQLSDSYSIAFLHDINDTNHPSYVIFKVDIGNFRKREEFNTEQGSEGTSSRGRADAPHR